MTIPKLETQRFLLQPVTEEDEAFYCYLYTDADVMKLIGPPLTQNAAERNFQLVLKAMQQNPWTYLCWRIIEKKSEQQVGITALIRNRKVQEHAEIGTMIPPELQSKRIASEIMYRTLGYGFSELNLSMQYAYFAVNHIASQKLVENLGFTVDFTQHELPGRLPSYYCYVKSGQLKLNNKLNGLH